MNKNNLTKFLKTLVSEPEEVKAYLGDGELVKTHVDFILQLDILESKNYGMRYVYTNLLLFLTKLPYNYIKMKQYHKEGKGKVIYCLPKRAFRQYVNNDMKSYQYKDIEKQLLKLGKIKVVTQKSVVTNLFEVAEIEDLKDYWCLIIHSTVMPYISWEITLTLGVLKYIQFSLTEQLSLKEMIDERKKAGLEIPELMNFQYEISKIKLNETPYTKVV